MVRGVSNGLASQRSQTGGYAMAEILKFVQTATVFDPEFIHVLATAFDNAWNKIEKSGSRFARPGYARAMREVIAKTHNRNCAKGCERPERPRR
jgi:hypothetical protein